MNRKILGEFKPYFIPANAILNFSINDKLDVTIQVSSDIEQKLYNQLSTTFNNEDIRLLRILYKLKDELDESYKYKWSKTRLAQQDEKIKKTRSSLT